MKFISFFFSQVKQHHLPLFLLSNLKLGICLLYSCICIICNKHRIIESQNDRMAWVEKDHSAH